MTKFTEERERLTDSFDTVKKQVNGKTSRTMIYPRKDGVITDMHLRELAGRSKWGFIDLGKMIEPYLVLGHIVTEIGSSKFVPSDITDNGLKYLATLPLAGLILDNNKKITNEGMRHLVKMDSLIELSVNDTNITAAGLVIFDSLANIAKLEIINAYCTSVTYDEAHEIAQLFYGRVHILDRGARVTVIADQSREDSSEKE